MENIRKELADIFDLRIENKTVKRGNRIISAMILLCALSTFLATVPSINAAVGGVLSVIDIFAVIFFTAEYILRVALCGENIDEYRGFKGKLKYIFSFFPIIDLLAVMPFYLSIFFDSSYEWLAVMRIFRLFRLFRFLGSYSYIIKGLKGIKDQFSISMQFLIIVTFVLSMVLYYVEVKAQPEVYSGAPESLLWAFMQYIGDPGGFADYSPVTTLGRVISVIIGVLGLAIFAIPAGLVGSAFTDAIDRKGKDEETRKNRDVLHTAFSRKYIKDGDSYLRIMPNFVYIEDLQARKQLSLENVQDIIRLQSEEKCSHRYRMKDIGKSVSATGSHITHQLVVEHYLVNSSYGYFHREPHSQVTIVANVHRSCMNLYAFYLAKIGGFNLIIKEEDPSSTYPSSWVSLEEDLVEIADNISGVKNSIKTGTVTSKERTQAEIDSFSDFVRDIQSCRKDGGVLIFMNAAEDESMSGVERKAGVHFVYGNKIGVNEYDPESLLISDPELMDRIIEGSAAVLNEKFKVETARNDYFRILKNNMIRHVWGGVRKRNMNKFYIKLNKELVVWDTRTVLIMKELAVVIAREVEGREIEITQDLKLKGLGLSGLYAED